MSIMASSSSDSEISGSSGVSGSETSSKDGEGKERTSSQRSVNRMFPSGVTQIYEGIHAGWTAQKKSLQDEVGIEPVEDALWRALPQPKELWGDAGNQGASFKLQHVLSGVQSQLDYYYKYNSAKANNESRARLLSNRQIGSSAVLQAIPTHKNLRVRDEAMQLYLRERVGISPTSEVRCTCKSGKMNPNHHYNCKMEGGLQLRHDLVCSVVNEMAKDAGFRTWTEPRGVYRKNENEAHPSQGGPDIELSAAIGTPPVLVDIAIVNYLQDNAKAKAASKPLHAATAMEQVKQSKYSSMAKAAGAHFVAAVWERSGALGQGARQLMERCSKAAETKEWKSDERSAWTARSFFNHHLQRIAVAIVIGNAEQFRFSRGVGRARRDIWQAAGERASGSRCR